MITSVNSPVWSLGEILPDSIIQRLLSERAAFIIIKKAEDEYYQFGLSGSISGPSSKQEINNMLSDIVKSGTKRIYVVSNFAVKTTNTVQSFRMYTALEKLLIERISCLNAVGKELKIADMQSNSLQTSLAST